MPTTQAYCNACGVNRKHEILSSAKSTGLHEGDPLLANASHDTLQCCNCELIQIRRVHHLSQEKTVLQWGNVLLWGKRILPIVAFLGAFVAIGFGIHHAWTTYQDFSNKHLVSKQEPLPENSKQEPIPETQRVEQFVASHPEVLSAVGAPVDATITGYSSRFFGFKPFLYVVSASGKTRLLHAHIKVDREVNPAALTLACMADPSKVESGSLGDACSAAPSSLK